MSTLDLGYLRLNLISGWIARLDFEGGNSSLSLIRDQAKAGIMLLSAGILDPEEALDQIYEKFERDFKSRGGHFDDLAEEFDDEMIAEAENSEDFAVEHLFLRAVGSLVVMAKLSNYGPQDEEDLRRILSSLEVGSLNNEQPAFEKVQIPDNLPGWDRLGSVAVSSGEFPWPK